MRLTIKLFLLLTTSRYIFAVRKVFVSVYLWKYTELWKYLMDNVFAGSIFPTSFFHKGSIFLWDFWPLNLKVGPFYASQNHLKSNSFPLEPTWRHMSYAYPYSLQKMGTERGFVISLLEKLLATWYHSPYL